MQDDRILQNALIELTAPDGRVFLFRYVDTVPYGGTDYIVLIEHSDSDGASPNTGQEQILITRMAQDEDGALSFEVATEEDIIESVLEKYTARVIRKTIESSIESDIETAHDGDAGCDCDECDGGAEHGHHMH